MIQGLPLLPEETIPKLAERILRLQSLESNMVVQASLHTLRVRAWVRSCLHNLNTTND